MRNLTTFLCVTIGVLSAGIARAVPVPQFVPGKPGLKAPFASSAAVDTWGKETLVAGYDFDGFSGASVNKPNGIVRYETTLENGAPTVTPMSATKDWVFSITMSHHGTETADFYFVGKANEGTGSEVRIFSLVSGGDGADFKLMLGPGAGVELANLGTLDIGENDFHDIAIHFQADTQAYDAWLDGVQVGFDVTNGAITDHGIDFFSIDDYSGSVDKWRQIQIGQVIPEPMSLGLVGLGSVLILARHRHGRRAVH